MVFELPTYLHRVNRDGSFDSICIRCFETIASAITEERLTTELEHKCAPRALSQRPSVKAQPSRSQQKLEASI
jgi:hypothetical protein